MEVHGAFQELQVMSSYPRKKAWEIFVLIYSPFWIVWALCILVPFQLYEHCNEWGYLLIGLATAVPCLVLPALLEPHADRRKPLNNRYWIKANLWIAIFSFVGNYLWTHYFYRLLGASYTFPSWRLNDVPIPLYLMTHAYFCFYHAVANVAIRTVRSAAQRIHPWAPALAEGITVFALGYIMALGETVTIAHFPYYTFQDRSKMLTVGSLFYAIYFFVSFPIFFRMDEEKKTTAPRSGLLHCAGQSLAATMVVTLLLDFWRIGLGPIYTGGSSTKSLPWL
ncbi:hypothetical protein WJX73_007201 [Symbiochloris irregularis]|uniref:Cycloeucalenol cycloisomerase n=1 Tax=Symbiochloris irregularis TaxID=706552 RepID=A0AAW1P5M1_9CHLO